MINVKKIQIYSSTNIKQALKVISEGGCQIALVVNNRGELIGTLTDGDIRTGLLKGYNLASSIKSIYFKKPIIAKITDTKEDLLKLAISKKIHQIPIVNKNGKLAGLHILDELIKPKNKSNQVVIMAGGKGMRLRPLTKNIPKPMLKVGNKPILQTIIEKFRESGYQKFIICVNFKSNIIKNYFGDGKKFGVDIEYIQEKKRMGTAGGLSLLKKKPKEPFFVINGDLLTNLDFDKMLEFHVKYNSKATMGVTEYVINSPYGEVKLDNENIESIEEKPTRKVFINAGVYILDPKCINFIPKKFYDMPTLFKDAISKKLKIISFPLGENWLDIGRPKDFKKAHKEYNHMF